MFHTNTLVEVYQPRGLHWPKHGRGYRVALHRNPCGRERIMGGRQWRWEEASWRSLPSPFALNALEQPYQLYLMRKWPLNSIFTASSPFHHLQQSVDGTSVLRNIWRHTDRGLEYKEEGYKRRGDLLSWKENFFEQCIIGCKTQTLYIKD